jgi:glycine/D-amino acid oxidase-like deaminating enzyme
VHVAVIGGGIQGCAIALELAGRGVRVSLFERRPTLLDGASRHTEGKIHLGLVYAADDSLRTARLMAQGAAAFAPALRRWLGPAAGRLRVSEPFHYVVHRASVRSPAELESAYRRIAAVVRERVAPGAYFGVADPGAVRRLEAGELDAFGADARAVFRTEELAVDPDALADALAAVVAAHPDIACRLAAEVSAVDARGRRLRLGAAHTERFDHIVNAAWDGRLALDATAGLAPPPRFVFRQKYFVRAPLAAPPPSSTIVLGPFGDVVDYGGGDTYLSWYPAARRGWSQAVQPPDWPSTLHGPDADDLDRRIVAGLAAVVPGAAGARVGRAAVRGGAIYALGARDVDDPHSELHERHRVGARTAGAYTTVDTGKYTLAPLFAELLADQLTGAVDAQRVA